MRDAFGRRIILVVGVVLATVFSGPDSLLAQSPMFKSGVELVPLTVTLTVTDRAGGYVPDPVRAWSEKVPTARARSASTGSRRTAPTTTWLRALHAQRCCQRVASTLYALPASFP
jgi:hypothetical protein